MQTNNSITITAPDTVSGSVTPVSSKSECNRALIINAISGNSLPITRISNSDDTRILKELLEKCVHGNALINADAGHAGTVMRFLTAFCASMPGEYRLTGSERMLQRPIGELVETLTHLGADIQFEDNAGFPPLRIHGKKIRGGKARIKAGTSSQFISALLLCAPRFEKGIELEIDGPVVSQPYIEMTVSIMRHFGVHIQKQNKTWIVEPASYSHVPFEAEGDWSAASYFYSVAALSKNASIELKGYEPQSHQGDRKVLSLFEKLGVDSHWLGNNLTLKKSNIAVPHFFEFDFTHHPDLAQTFAVCCAGLGIEAKLHGLQTLRIKETDRVEAIASELKKLGIETEITHHTLWIKKGKVTLTHSPIKTYGDHRMAMSFAPLALVTNKMVIQDADVVTKSYPEYWNDLKAIGFSVI